jgi:hypothetical protein
MNLKPDYCTSVYCSGPLSAKGHCPNCSHAEYKGQGADSKCRVWKWTHNRYFGPLFNGQDGQALKRQPGTQSMAWKVFEAWYKKRFGKK